MGHEIVLQNICNADMNYNIAKRVVETIKLIARSQFLIQDSRPRTRFSVGKSCVLLLTYTQGQFYKLFIAELAR